MSGEKVLTVRGLTVVKGKKKIIDIPEMEVTKGEFVAVTGPNGAGKSTLLKALSFLERPSSGEIAFNGKIVSGSGETLAARRQMAMLFQDSLLLSGCVLDNVAVGLKLRGIPKKTSHEKAKYWIEKLKISHLINREARTLSGGEAQRVSLARAFMLEPEIVYLDEPFTFLDMASKASIMGELKDILTETGTTALMVTHDFSDIPYLANRMVVMIDGFIRQSGPVQDVMDYPLDVQVARFLGIDNIWQGQFTENDDGAHFFVSKHEGPPFMVQCNRPSHEKMNQNRPVSACIRPEKVKIKRRQEVNNSAIEPNKFTGRIEAVYPYGYYYRIKIDIGLIITALVGTLELANPPQAGEWVDICFSPRDVIILA